MVGKVLQNGRRNRVQPLNLELRKIRIALTALSSIPELYCLSAL